MRRVRLEGRQLLLRVLQLLGDVVQLFPRLGMPVEHDVTRPFAGRAGRELVRWMLRAGFADEEDFRARVWITSTTTCFPGRRPDGAGDRRPGPAEVALCAGWLEAVLHLLAPRLVIPVGSLALSRLLGGLRLDDAVGRAFDAAGRPVEEASPTAGRVLVPLPHPSGQSRWLNDPARRRRLDAALELLSGLLDSGLPERVASGDRRGARALVSAALKTFRRQEVGS